MHKIPRDLTPAGFRGGKRLMSSVWLRCSLWLSLLLFLPIPFWAFGTGWASVAWLAEISAFTAAVFLIDGGMVATMMAATLVTQTILWAALLFFASARIVHRLPASRRTGFVAAAGLALFAVALLLPIYATSFVRDGQPVNLIGLFQ